MIIGVFASLVVPAASASTTVLPYGNDYSWPQCPRGVGNGQGAPLPSGQHAFAIVGLTDGVGMVRNPCLGSEWSYARAHASFLTGYAVPTYPTRAETAAAYRGRYGRCTTLNCRLMNAGWAESNAFELSLLAVHAHPPVVWIDVEIRHRNPWSASVARNATVIRAVIAGLRAKGHLVGIYSTSAMWREIAGGFRTTLPEWVPAVSLTRGCVRSFAGGPVWLSQWTHTYPSGQAYDENGRCPGTRAMASWWLSSAAR